jgi:non-heme chloroperoxidase
MNTFETKDGTTIYYKDWGTGPVVTFSHGWPLSADAWDAQMLFLGQCGFRVIAHDRRGHGRSGQTWEGNNMDQYADDLAELLDHLDVKHATMVGHSTGGGEVVRYIARHGQKTDRSSSCYKRRRRHLREDGRQGHRTDGPFQLSAGFAFCVFRCPRGWL